MTRTKEQIRKAIFGKLRGLQRKLLAHGVSCTYARSVLSHDSGEIAFTITCGLTEDQASLLPQINVRTAAGTESFDHLSLDQSIARLKELFHVQDSSTGGQKARSDTHSSTKGEGDGTTAQDSNSYVVTPN